MRKVYVDFLAGENVLKKFFMLLDKHLWNKRMEYIYLKSFNLELPTLHDCFLDSANTSKFHVMPNMANIIVILLFTD